MPLIIPFDTNIISRIWGILERNSFWYRTKSTAARSKHRELPPHTTLIQTCLHASPSRTLQREISAVTGAKSVLFLLPSPQWSKPNCSRFRGNRLIAWDSMQMAVGWHRGRRTGWFISGMPSILRFVIVIVDLWISMSLPVGMERWMLINAMILYICFGMNRVKSTT